MTHSTKNQSINIGKTSFIAFAVISITVLLYLNYGRIGDKGASASGVIFTENAPKPIGPYSQAVVKGNCLFVSGQIGLDPQTNVLDTSSVENETKRVMENIKTILLAAKMDISMVAKTTIYLTDMNDFKTVNEVYGGYFPKDPPARETVQVAALPKGARVEISVIAVK